MGHEAVLFRKFAALHRPRDRRLSEERVLARSRAGQAGMRRSRRGLVSDEPVKSVTIYDLAIGRAPGLWREWIEH